MIFTKQKRKLHKKEPGSTLDTLGTFLVMGFCIALVLMYACLGKTVQMKLFIDETGKTYLYQMEENGYLSSEDEEELTKTLLDAGVKAVAVDRTVTVNEDKQVAYGDIIKLSFDVKFPNPLMSFFVKQNYDPNVDLFSVDNSKGLIPAYIDYHYEQETTSKW